MTFLFELECAVWHPTASADSIKEAVGLSPKSGGSVGTLNSKTGRVLDRTCCWFDLGAFSQDEISEGLQMLAPFESLKKLPEFNDGKGRITVYFKDNKDASELYLNLRALEMLQKLDASVVFW